MYQGGVFEASFEGEDGAEAVGEVQDDVEDVG
jgi:hypothetical protein